GREGLQSLRVFGCLPVSGARGCTEAGVRKASKEETAGEVCAGGSVGLWGFKARFCATWPLSDGTAGLDGERGRGFWLGSVAWGACQRAEGSGFWRPRSRLRAPSAECGCCRRDIVVGQAERWERRQQGVAHEVSSLIERTGQKRGWQPGSKASTM